ncbi:hypothetical protein [Aeromonas hydrophila]|uniref:hypothetical protein n=1 Tax=Aeromonas hydrophila TaxID=644 RepID=UPI00207B1B7F|nr:hypothetical protein [Aeromonas hydrophila]
MTNHHVSALVTLNQFKPVKVIALFHQLLLHIWQQMDLAWGGTVFPPPITLFKKIQHYGGVTLIHDCRHGVRLYKLGIKSTLCWHHKNNGAKACQYIYPG